MNTINNSRIEKTLQDNRQEYLQAKFLKVRDQRIEYYRDEIQREKANIIEAINQDFFIMAAARIKRIESLQESINNLYK